MKLEPQKILVLICVSVLSIVFFILERAFRKEREMIETEKDRETFLLKESLKSSSKTKDKLPLP